MVRDKDGYELIDWNCNPKYYADQLGVQVWRRLSSNCALQDGRVYDIIIKKNEQTIGDYYYIHWDCISVILDFCIKYHNLK